MTWRWALERASLGAGIAAISMIVRVALLPLTVRIARQARAQQTKLRALQPRADALRKRFENETRISSSELARVARRLSGHPRELRRAATAPPLAEHALQRPWFDVSLVHGSEITYVTRIDEHPAHFARFVAVAVPLVPPNAMRLAVEERTVVGRDDVRRDTSERNHARHEAIQRTRERANYVVRAQDQRLISHRDLTHAAFVRFSSGCRRSRRVFRAIDASRHVCERSLTALLRVSAPHRGRIESS
jgi:hypothetical protein